MGRGLPRPILLVVPAPSAADLGRARMEATLRRQLDEANEAGEPHERISHVIVCGGRWTTENGLLTHTLKTLRDEVEARYLPVIRQCAKGLHEGAIVWEDDVV